MVFGILDVIRLLDHRELRRVRQAKRLIEGVQVLSNEWIVVGIHNCDRLALSTSRDRPCKGLEENVVDPISAANFLRRQPGGRSGAAGQRHVDRPYRFARDIQRRNVQRFGENGAQHRAHFQPLNAESRARPTSISSAASSSLRHNLPLGQKPQGANRRR